MAKLFFLIFALMLAACESKEEVERRRQAAVDSCINSYERKCKSACQRDPKFMYCSTKYGNDVIGSGCSSMMNSLSNSEQISKCEKLACPVDYDVISACSKNAQ